MSMWTDERVATLRKLWLEGLSAREVADQLGGLTRNAVIGKVHRLGLSGRVGPSQPRRLLPPRSSRPVRGRPIRPRPMPPSPAARRVAVPVAQTPDEPGLIGCVTGLRGHVCKWPIGDPKADDFSFCGARIEHEGPYCPRHHRRAHQPGKLAPLSQDAAFVRLLAA